MLSITLLTGCLLAVSPAIAQTTPSLAVPEVGTSAYEFDLSQVSLSNSRWKDNENRTLNYLKAVNVDRLLYNFRATHKLSTNGAQPNGGWDAPNFPFRSHAQGHYLTAWVHCYATLRDNECKNRASYFVQELAKCQANNGAAQFSTGYLSGFPESEFVALEAGQLKGGNVPYYAVHKTMAGLLDAWRIIGDTKARDVLLALAGWVDGRTKKLSSSQMQTMLGTEFGGMNDVLAAIYQLTGNQQWLTVAQRFDHASQFDPLANNQDRLSGNHANTQVPKWIGAAREYKSTGTKRYLDIAKNAWDFTINAHTYAIGGNSQAEHFRPPNQISNFLTNDTAEQCNTYNMLKLTRDLWTTDPSSTKYFDYYERALINHLLGAQNPTDNHGHITYFTPLKSGGRRGIGPAWGGGTWSTDYNSFWCCQGTALETNTKLMDSIYFYDSSALYVNLFTPSTLDWKQRSVKISQVTTFPASDTTTLTVTGTGNWAMKIRIPSWTSGATISINGQASGVAANPGSYATLSRDWKSGDIVTVKLPMKLRTVAANDNANIAAVAFGPVILSGNYGQQALNSMPSLALNTVRRTSTDSLAFTATANGQAVNLGPFYDAHNINYNVYWTTSGSFSN
ncbi:hypothetical protein HBI88_149790 [Parastagonospora nodorum]|nr:hypothetical protein HBI97_012070 [Parastagonospora nodorum]KAH5810605.1 hypothetical protein HBI94_152430 [Parastagonospora nodorum]KAH5841704.1 hypothetical protein HBI93_011260 [Parastagonospora nodorum]KAH5843988.1 hypothetical protein HBI96_010010 [Parastagonospora nodorum]KAH5855628.1 hypothetical protein HBI91_162540 [Parastagonospora nodorum]